MEIINSAELTDFADTCAECRREFIGILKDVILYLRAAAAYSSSDIGIKDYYRTEIEVRIRLSKFLTNTKDQKLIDDFWSENFEGLGDVMQRLDLGNEYHNEAIAARDRMLSEKSFVTWAKAIRSCDVWDFKRGKNRDMPGLKAALLCVEECRVALRRIRKRADAIPGIDKEEITDALDSLLPALDVCPRQPKP